MYDDPEIDFWYGEDAWWDDWSTGADLTGGDLTITPYAGDAIGGIADGDLSINTYTGDAIGRSFDPFFNMTDEEQNQWILDQEPNIADTGEDSFWGNIWGNLTNTAGNLFNQAVNTAGNVVNKAINKGGKSAAVAIGAQNPSPTTTAAVPAMNSTQMLLIGLAAVGLFLALRRK